jgi:ubiquitin carboxyl-terminal hydrolase L5
MRGLAITNSPTIRPAHNSLARYVLMLYMLSIAKGIHSNRPVDIRASLNNLIITTFNAEKRKAMEKKTTEVKPPPAKRAKTTAAVKSRKVKGKEKEQNTDNKEDEEETYHFIGYVPAYGKVWELEREYQDPHHHKWQVASGEELYA